MSYRKRFPKGPDWEKPTPNPFDLEGQPRISESSYHGMEIIGYMKNIFTEHPSKVGETYFQHLWFALKVALKSLIVSTFFVIHAFFPCFYIPKFLNLEGFIKWLYQANENRESKKHIGSSRDST